jgi:peptidoglycan/xylan/chitin deacetylase (PgdA/CDA1 family)
MYHSVAENGDALTVKPASFEEHLDYLQRAGFTTVTLQQVIDHEDGRASLPAHPIVLTFDDGYEDAYGAALPQLKARGMKATFFLVSSFLGPDVQHRRSEGGKSYLVWQEALALRDAGMEIGSHTVHHRKLTDLPVHDRRVELEQSKKDLESGLAQPVLFFAYPFTSQHFRARSAVRTAGYRAAVAGAHGGGDRYQLQRITVHRFTTVGDLRDLLGESWATGFTTGGG